MTTIQVKSEAIQTLIKETFSTISTDYRSIAQDSIRDIKDYLSKSRLTEREKADIYANFNSNITNGSLQSVIALAGDISKFNADLEIRMGEISYRMEQTNLIKEQIEQEKYKRINLMPEELLNIKKDFEIKAQTLLNEIEKLNLLKEEILKVRKETALMEKQATQEEEKITHALTQKQADLLNQQAISFKGHNLSKAADSLAQIIGMVVAEGAVPKAEIMTAHSKCITELGNLAGVTINAFTSAKN